VPAESLVNLPLELPLSERPDARERSVQKEDKMKSQPRRNARTTRRVALMILGTVMYLVGTCGLLTSTAHAAVDFGLSVSPSTLSLAPGTSNSYTLTFSPAPASTTTFSVTGLPSGVTFSPPNVPASTASASLKMTATAAAPLGSNSLTIKATDTSGSQSVSPITLVVGYAVPFIDSITPLSAAPGGGDFTLTVYGGGFVSGVSQINWTGPGGTAALSPTTCTATSCSGPVPGDYITATTNVYVTVWNPGVPASNVFFFPVIGSTPSVSFSRKDYAAGNGPSSVAVADFKGNRILDLAVANQVDNTVSILLGNGDGTFQTQVPYSTGGYTPVSVAVGDFKNNGKLDLAVVNACGSSPSCTTGTVSILLGKGDGTFTLGSSFSTGVAPTFVAVGDFNRDGNLDLAVANGTDDTVSILLGDGTGNFTLNSSPATGDNPTWVAVGDFNDDGILDLAVANAGTASSRGDTITVLLGNGDGTFTPTGASPIPSEGYSPVALGVGFFNNSFYNLDLAVANACGTSSACTSGGKVAILTGDGTGAFTFTSDTSAGSGPSALAVADLNADGKLDVAVADATASAVSILLGDGAGNLSLQISPAPPSTGATPSSIAIGDFNGDGTLGLVTANQNAANVSVLLAVPTVALACGAGEPTGTTCTISPSPGFAASLSFGSEPADGTLGPMTLTLTNGSNLPLSIGSIALTAGSPNFTLSSNTCPATLPASEFCTIGVTFSPASQGSHGGFIEITDNAPGSPQLISLTGTGTAAAASVSPTTLPFGNMATPGPSAAQLVTLSAAASLTGISFSASSPFTAQPQGTDGTTCGSTLAADSSCIIAVTFSPSTAGYQTGTLTITDTAGTPPTLTQTVSLSGTGIQASASVTPGGLTFNQVFGSTSVAQAATLSNTGAAPLTNINIFVSAPTSGFAETNNCGSSIPAYGNCTIYVTFTPLVTGTLQMTALSITDSGGSTVNQDVSLYGTGIKANTSSLITSNTPNPQIVGQPVTVSFTVTATPPSLPGTPTPTGTVTVSDGTGDTCGASLTSGTGSCNLTPTTPGAKTLTASYPGDSNFNASVSPGASQTVTKASTTTSITNSTIPKLVVGEPLSVSFKVTPPTNDILTPTGTVTVSDGAGDSCMATLSGSATASCTLTPTTPGPKTLTASYSGDRNFKSSTTSLTNALAVVDFSISVTPNTQTVLKESTGAIYTLTLVPLGGFTGTVDLACSDTQADTTCTLGSKSISVGGPSVKIKVSQVGSIWPLPHTFTITLTGTFGSGTPSSGGLTHSASADLTIKSGF
jgi:hypothetical protein